MLQDSNGDFIQGTVSDVSNSGFAVGTFFDTSFNSFGYIWNPDFTNGVRIFEEWLEEVSPGANFPFATINVNSISQGDGELFFTVAGNAGEFAYVDVIIEFPVGDVNRDGTVNFLDIAGFISVLATGDYQAEADINGDNAVDFLDIGPFIGLLSA